MICSEIFGYELKKNSTTGSIFFFHLSNVGSNLRVNKQRSLLPNHKGNLMQAQKKTLTGIIILSTALGFTLTSCANPIQSLTEQAVEQAIESETGTDVDFDAGGGASLPNGWPSEIPAPEGSIILATTEGEPGSQTWYVMVTVKDAAAEYKKVTDKLLSSGYTAQSEGSIAGGQFGTYTNSMYTVDIATITTEGADSTMTVTVREGGM